MDWVKASFERMLVRLRKPRPKELMGITPELSAKRTIENSPAIYRWVGNTQLSQQSAKRTVDATTQLEPWTRSLPLPVLTLRRLPSTEVLGYFRVVRSADTLSR